MCIRDRHYGWQCNVDVEQRGEAFAIDVMFARKWRDYAFKNALKTKKQKTTLNF